MGYADFLERKFAAIHRVGLPSIRRYAADRELVMLPQDLSLRDNREETVNTILRIRNAVFTNGKQASLYFDNLKQLEPGATICLAAEINRCNSLRRFRQGDPVVGNYPSSPEIYAQLKEMGFYRLLKVAEPEDVPTGSLRDNRPLFLRFISSANVEAVMAAGFTDLVSRGAFEMGDATKRSMVAAIKEAMGNADEHAYRPDAELPVMRRRWWLAGHLDPREREMMVMIFDQGVGIPNTLSPDLFEKINALRSLRVTPSDSAMISAATELHRTSTGQEGRGKGFRDMKRFVERCDDGELRVSSNRGLYVYTKEKELSYDYSASLGGTLIEWRVRHGSTAEIGG